MFCHTCRMCPTESTRLTPIRHVALILSWGKASDWIKNTPPPFKGLSFLLMDCIVPLACVTESGVPNSKIDRKIMKYAEGYEMATLYFY
jgi:hypothetical protein